MANIGKPTREQPEHTPVPWREPEPRREPSPVPTPNQPQKV